MQRRFGIYTLNFQVKGKHLGFIIYIYLACLISCVNIDSIDENIFPKTENAIWVYFEVPKNINVEKSGQYQKDIKFGKWKYHIDNKHFRDINWKIISNERLKLILPENWKVDTTLDNYLFFSFPEDSSGYFVILEKVNPDYNSIDYLSEMYAVSLNDTSENLVDKFARILIPNEDENQLSYMFDFQRNEKRYNVLGMLLKRDNRLFEITYRSQIRSEFDNIWLKVVFTEIVNNLFIDDRKVVSSFEEYIEITDLEFE